MTAVASGGERPSRGPLVRRIVVAAAIVVVLALMALSTKVVGKGQVVGSGGAPAFSAAAYGKKTFPVQQKFIEQHAVDASTLAAALAKDPTAAGTKYGVANDSGAGPEVPVKFTGTVGKADATGLPVVKVPGLPKDTVVHVQLGPAINGTDLRDATGRIQLGQFENQIQYQDAASALNDRLKAELKKAGAPDLTGKTITVAGVFQLINPKNWNVTPATISVKS